MSRDELKTALQHEYWAVNYALTRDGKGAQYSTALTVSKTEVSIGCQKFTGVNAKRLLAWAMSAK
jgi:hypothetical protein